MPLAENDRIAAINDFSAGVRALFKPFMGGQFVVRACACSMGRAIACTRTVMSLERDNVRVAPGQANIFANCLRRFVHQGTPQCNAQIFYGAIPPGF
jgi:hypothetical protein